MTDRAPQVDDDGVTAPARSSGERLDRLERTERIALRISIAQTILATIGFLIGVVALYAALNEADSVRKQQQASVWPHIRIRDMNIGTVGEERFEVIVGNRGIGPAVVKYVEAVIDGEERTSWHDIVALLPIGDERIGVSNEPILGAVISPNEDITLVSIEARFASAEVVANFRNLVRSDRANLIICYCSVFDDCWRVDAKANETVATPECPAPNPATEL